MRDRSFFALASLLSLGVACGGSNKPAGNPAPNASTSAAPSASVAPAPDASKRDATTHAHARELGAAALTMRRANAGACPTIKDLTDKYAFAPDTENDASGAPLAIECTDAEIHVVTSKGAIVLAEVYVAASTSPAPTAPLADRSAPASQTSVPVNDAERVIASLRPSIKRCYQRALETDPTTSGTFHGKWIINPDGTVKDLIVDPKSTIKDPAFRECLLRLGKNLSFLPASDGKVHEISF